MLPELVHTALRKWFQFPHNEIYCQVATFTGVHPHIRTMMLYKVTEDGKLVFLTGTDTQKWRDLQDHDHVAVCLFNLEYGQIIGEGTAVLKTNKKQADEAAQYWHLLSPAWRDIYRGDSAENLVPDSFGVIVVTPKRWEVLQLNKEKYLKSIRKEFVFEDGSWLMEELRPA